MLRGLHRPLRPGGSADAEPHRSQNISSCLHQGVQIDCTLLEARIPIVQDSVGPISPELPPIDNPRMNSSWMRQFLAETPTWPSLAEMVPENLIRVSATTANSGGITGRAGTPFPAVVSSSIFAAGNGKLPCGGRGSCVPALPADPLMHVFHVSAHESEPNARRRARHHVCVASFRHRST